jgi:hypothetical protein
LAVEGTIIKAVRIIGSDGASIDYPWDPSTWYIIRDDCPHLDILTTSYGARPRGETTLQPLGDPAPEGEKWQRWNLEADLASHRRLGEASLSLKVPKDCTLRCYVVPTLLLSYRDVFAMLEDIETELQIAAVWDRITERPERSWSRRGDGGATMTPSELVHLVDVELRAALWVRRDPFTELGPQSRRGLPLAENALVSHWAARRLGQLQHGAAVVATERKTLYAKASRRNPDGRQSKIEDEIKRLASLEHKLAELLVHLAHLINDVELMAVVYPSPSFQRDHRLRQLLRAFAPRFSEALSAVESSRSHYPPVFLNDLWELWGAVWLVKEFRRLGFKSVFSKGVADGVKSWSWQFRREDIVLDLDYEADPTFIDYNRLPPAHERDVPALEWAARNQEFDVERPFFGTEPQCSPDYILRITTPKGKTLVVGDASLASPKHHGKTGKQHTKPHTVERYRRTLGWINEGQVFRCHPMGGFIMFPSPATAWKDFQQLPGASDCTLLCPSPLGDPEASRRLENLLAAVAPEVLQPEAEPYAVAG